MDLIVSTPRVQSGREVGSVGPAHVDARHHDGEVGLVPLEPRDLGQRLVDDQDPDRCIVIGTLKANSHFTFLMKV